MTHILHDDARGPGRLVVLFGGPSAEHDVSIASARSVLRAIAGRRALLPVLIDRQGRAWDEATSLAALGMGEHEPAERHAVPVSQLALAADDVVFPLLHGPYGEDGSVQGWLRLAGLAYVGSGVHASAVGMDKLSMKAVFGAHGLPQVAYRGVLRRDFRRDPEAVVDSLASLGWPRFVKPANLGSSLGIHRVPVEDELIGALDDAFRYDHRVIVEAGVAHVRELEVAVLGNDRPAASSVGEIRYTASFYDYDAKYSPGGAALLIPAPIDDGVAERATRLALRAFDAIDATGLARVDLFLDPADGHLYVNEINTMPGFTETSMYPRLWDAAGLPYPELVDRLVTLAWELRPTP